MATKKKSKSVVWNWYSLEVWDQEQTTPRCKSAKDCRLISTPRKHHKPVMSRQDRGIPLHSAALHWVVEFPLSSCLLSLLSDWPIRYLRVRPNSHFMQCCDRVCVVCVSSSAYCECTQSDRGRYRMRGPHPPPQVDFHRNPQKRLGPSPLWPASITTSRRLKGKNVLFFF